MIRWLRYHGEIIGCERDGKEYTLFGVCKNTTLHELYHEELKREYTDGFSTKKDNKK